MNIREKHFAAEYATLFKYRIKAYIVFIIFSGFSIIAKSTKVEIFV